MNMRFMSCMLLVVMAIGIDVRAAQNPADALVRAIRGTDPVNKSLALAIQLVESGQDPQSLKKYLSEQFKYGNLPISRGDASYQALVRVKNYLDKKIATLDEDLKQLMSAINSRHLTWSLTNVVLAVADRLMSKAENNKDFSDELSRTIYRIMPQLNMDDLTKLAALRVNYKKAFDKGDRLQMNTIMNIAVSKIKEISSRPSTK